MPTVINAARNLFLFLRVTAITGTVWLLANFIALVVPAPLAWLSPRYALSLLIFTSGIAVFESNRLKTLERSCIAGTVAPILNFLALPCIYSLVAQNQPGLAYGVSLLTLFVAGAEFGAVRALRAELPPHAVDVCVLGLIAGIFIGEPIAAIGGLFFTVAVLALASAFFLAAFLVTHYKSKITPNAYFVLFSAVVLTLIFALTADRLFARMQLIFYGLRTT